MRRILQMWVLGLLAGLLSLTVHAQVGEHLTLAEFIDNSFDDQVAPQKHSLWLNKDHKKMVREILGHDYATVRVKYWSQGERSAWVLEEVGKDMPITFGIVVRDGAIADIQVLQYRESRGGEIRHPFFTRQFLGSTLSQDGSGKGQRPALSHSIDGITGATLSVRAMKKIATLALYFHQQVTHATVAGNV